MKRTCREAARTVIFADVCDVALVRIGIFPEHRRVKYSRV